MSMLICVTCGSLQFRDVGRSCPACGSVAGFVSEPLDFSHGLDFDFKEGC